MWKAHSEEKYKSLEMLSKTFSNQLDNQWKKVNEKTVALKVNQKGYSFMHRSLIILTNVKELRWIVKS